MSILILGEAWGEQEAEAQQPFVGKSGWLIKQLLSQTGLAFDDCYVTNVFNLQPKPKNDIINLCGSKAEGIPGMPALVRSKYVRAEYVGELRRLYEEINSYNPNVILALGSTAVWALTGIVGIKQARGTTLASSSPATQATGVRLNRIFKLLPTYHPATVLRDWTLRPVVLADLAKMKREAAFPEIRRPSRKIWIEPTLEDLAQFEREHIVPAERLSIDIETRGEQITCVGFAPSPDTAIVVPFWTTQGNYWATLEDELTAWRYIARWCSMRPSVFQNGMYDIHRLWRTYGIPCRLASDDTMLLHHALQPEMEKSLGFQATIYTNEASWKFMSRTDTLKKED